MPNSGHAIVFLELFDHYLAITSTFARKFYTCRHCLKLEYSVIAFLHLIGSLQVSKSHRDLVENARSLHIETYKSTILGHP